MLRKTLPPTARLLTVTLAFVALAPTRAVNAQAAASANTWAGGAAPPARSVLDGYVAEALRANLALAQQRAEVDRAHAAERETRARYLPSVDINARYSQTSGVVNIGDFINPAYTALNQLIGQPRFPTNVNATLPFKQESKVELTLPLFNDGLNAAAVAARAQRDLVGASRRVAMRQLAADVQQAWLGYASLDQAVQTLEATLPVLDENLRVSQRLIDAGQATPDALLRARAERSDIAQQLDDTRRQRNAARRAFNLLRDRDGDDVVTLSADSSLLAAPTQSRDALVAFAITHREELQQAQTGIRLADAQRRAATAGYLPSLALSASYGIQGNQYRLSNRDDVGLVNLVLSWNLFSGGQTTARREAALALRTESSLRVREAERAVRLQVANAYDAVESTRNALVTANDRYASAQRAFVLVQRRFAEGLANQVEFISARSSFTAAAINQILTRYTFASRVVELERAAALRSLPE